MDDQTAGALSRLFAKDLKLDPDTHEARTALGSLLLALKHAASEPEDWISDGGPDGRPIALLLAGNWLIEADAGWKGSGPADVRVASRGLVDKGAVIEMDWQGATIEDDLLHHVTAWTFKFPDGGRVRVPGLIRTMPGENEMLDEGETFAREVASRLEHRPA